jgi:hypothetical protein
MIGGAALDLPVIESERQRRREAAGASSHQRRHAGPSWSGAGRKS